MKIASSDISMASSSSYSYQKTVEQSASLSVVDRTPAARAEPQREQAVKPNSALDVYISDLAKFFQNIEQPVSATSAAPNVEELSEESENDPRVQLIKTLIEYMLGHGMQLFGGVKGNAQESPSMPHSAETQVQPDAPPPRPSPQAWSMEFHSRTSIKETEQTHFQSSGVVRTADNREIKFDLSFDLQREYRQESSVDIVVGNGKKIDPLVLNFSSSPVRLTDQKFAFDLNADGKKEDISFVDGAGFLALDKNHNGKIDNGKELFGPQSGNGFAELQQYDVDHNGWIDENDPVYEKLQVWTKNAVGKDHLASLKEAHVGALYLGNVSTNFSINDAQNKPQAQLVKSGMWLSEAGQAHSLQQIDLVA